MIKLPPVKNCYIVLLFVCLFSKVFSQNKVIAKTESFDRQTSIEFKFNTQHQLMYKMMYMGRQVTDWSLLGLVTDGPELSKIIAVESIDKNDHKEIFEWPLGEDRFIKNNYREMILHCKTVNATFQILVRVYNGSFAFRYCYPNPKKERIRVKEELSEFNLAESFCIYQYHEESVFRAVSSASFSGISDLPSTLVSDHHIYLSIGEADNRNYSKCVLVKGRGENNLSLNFYIDTTYRNHGVIDVHKDSNVVFKDTLLTPWRTISCAKSAIGLHNFSQLNIKLVSPLLQEVPKGIIPGKVFRVPNTTQGALDGIEFASRMNFQYIMFDAGWYGAEFRTVSDPTKPIAELDLRSVIDQARKKDIAVILYVNYVGLKAKLDTILPLYKKWGVSGLKFGFVDGGTQKGICWLDTAVKKANEYGFVINIHDHYKPTGLSRRYPFNLSQEGIRGDENSPDAFHTMVLPYTRFIAGAADFTFCYPSRFNSYSKNLKVSKGQQLALTVIYFDPLQSVFWYGKPQEYDTKSVEVEFLKYVPTVWDESHYLKGEIGENISVARRKGDTWYIGIATGMNEWKTKIKLDFLSPGKIYEGSIYADDGNGGIVKRVVKLKNVFVIDSADWKRVALILPH